MARRRGQVRSTHLATGIGTAMGMDTMMSRQKAPMTRTGMVLRLVVRGSGVMGWANLVPTPQRALSGRALGAVGGAAGAATGALLSGTTTTGR